MGVRMSSAMMKYISVLIALLVAAPYASAATNRIDCDDSMISTDVPVFALPDLRCWRNIRGDYIYDYVHAERANKKYVFIGLGNARRNGAMNFEPDVKTIIKSVSPKSYRDARGWSDDREIETKFPMNATYAEFRAWDMNCFGFVQYNSPKLSGYMFLLSGVNCEARTRKFEPQNVAEIINQMEFSEYSGTGD